PPPPASYLQWADAYRAGGRGQQPVTNLRRVPLHGVEVAAKQLAGCARWMSEEPPRHGANVRWVDARIAEAAVMMHVEAALIALNERSSAEACVHAEAAATVLEAIQAEAAVRRRPDSSRKLAPLRPRLDRARFYSAFAEACLALGNPQLADDLATRGLRAEPTDARLLHVAGCVKETLMVVYAVDRKRGEVEEARRAAEKLLHDALAVEADNTDARLRLARVLVDEDRLVEAQPLLEAVTRAEDGRLRYLGWLFLGRLHHQRQAWTEAADAYGQAMREQPENQAARFGLAAVLEQQSGPAAARPLLLTTLSLSERADRQGDPWWSYPLGPVRMAADLLEELTGQVRAP
ncbi:MAG TPA: tetratricopeptide repeat protein, partial [Vicinamibacteria bacterium]|nr:tetratricopeptide repeat protein [Vicinamibacteria bacterium]